MRKQGYLQISFGWLFAIIVGAFILFLAIFAMTKLIGTEQTTIDAKTGKQIGVLLNPLETGFETAKTTSFTLPAETRIYNKCNNNGVFGRQIIQISQKSFNKWTETDVDVGFSNKYIFSERYTQGKKFYVFSKPFEFPFKVTDLIYMTSSSDQYCFIEAPEEVKDEILDLNQENLLVENCTEPNIKVCFNFGNCDINVDYAGRYVEKDNKKMYFEGDTLMYAAIFSEPEVYECQLMRLMRRLGNLALLYKDKAVFISRVGCSSNLNTNLLALNNAVMALNSSSELSLIDFLSEDIKEENEKNWECKLW
jgi:hypothetical protein